MLKLTLVSLSYNHKAYVKQAIESFIGQKTNFDYEIIIADDCSTDGTADIIDEYSKKYKIIKPILRKANIGVINNYLDAMSQAKSQYAAYCECDDYFTDPYKLQKQVDFLDAHPECSICFHKAKTIYDDNSGIKSLEIPTLLGRFKKNTFTIGDLLKENFIPSNSVMYRWRFLEENIYDNFPKDIMPADYYMHLLHAQKGNISFMNECMTIYRKHKNGILYNDNVFFEKYIFSFLKFIENVLIKLVDESHDFCENDCIGAMVDSMSRYVTKKNILSLIPDSTISSQLFMFVLYRHVIVKKKLRFKKKLLIMLSVIEAIVILLLYAKTIA